jgi:hypothetical protein
MFLKQVACAKLFVWLFSAPLEKITQFLKACYECILLQQVGFYADSDFLILEGN